MDNYFRCRINLTKPLDLNFIHVHPDQIVALYYCNLTWSPEHGGETIFYTDDMLYPQHNKHTNTNVQ